MTEAKVEELTQTAIIAVRTMLGTCDSDPAVYWAAARTAADAVTSAILVGAQHRDIALRTGCDGLTIAGLIQDQGTATHALLVECHHARRYVTLVQHTTARHVLRLLGPDDTNGSRQELAKQLDVSPSQLGQWIVEVLEEGNQAAPQGPGKVVR